MSRTITIVVDEQEAEALKAYRDGTDTVEEIHEKYDVDLTVIIARVANEVK